MTSARLVTALCVCTWCALAAGASAQPNDGAVRNVESAEDFDLDTLLGRELDEQLGTTESVSRRVEKVLGAPTAITSLNHQAIRLSGAATIPELLRLVAGVQVYQTAPGSYIVNVRGTGGVTANNTVVMVNGIPVNSPLDGTIAWDVLPVALEDVERVEVVRGPVSTIYGANAYTGVINIMTYRGPGLGSHRGLRGRGGSDLRGNPVALGSGRWLERGENLTVGGFVTGVYDLSHADPEPGAGVAHEPWQAAAGLGSFSYHRGEHTTTLEAGGGRAARSSLEHLVLEARRQQDTSAFGSLGHTYAPEHGRLERVMIWGRANSMWIDADQDDYQGFSYVDTAGVRASVGVDLRLRLTDALLVDASGSGQLDWIDAPYLHPVAQAETRLGYGVGAGLTVIPASELSVTLAGRVDTPPVSGDVRYSYRASAVYATENLALRASGARAFRAPTYVEAASRFMDPQTNHVLLEGDPGIAAPTHDSAELAVTWAPLATLNFGINTFFSRLSNVMVEDFAPLVRKTYVTDPAPRYLLGMELEQGYRHRDWLQWTTTLTYLHWFDTAIRRVPTVGDPDQNPSIVASARAWGTWANETMGYGLSGSIASRREYRLTTGIPPKVLDTSISAQPHVLATYEYFLGDSWPLWLSLRAQALLGRAVESPLPGAGMVGTRLLVGVEYRAP